MDKMIEELAKDIHEATRRASAILVEETRAYVKANHHYHSKNDFDKAHTKTLAELEAEYLTEQGYRKQVEAEWIDLHKGRYENPLYVCSACRKGAFLKIEADELNNPKMVQALTDYCPHCGAKMKGN